jgi:hypothetical protein
MTRIFRASQTRAPVIAAALLCATMLVSGCATFATGGDDTDAAVADARDAGLTPYWLGNTFVVGETPAEATGAAFHDPKRPQFSIDYRLGEGASGLMIIQTYSEAEGHWKRHLDISRTIPSLSIQPTRIGPWPAERWMASSGSRPVNTLRFVLHMDGMVVIATAKATSTGVPGTDLNPLINADLWREVLEEHLQPYPE